MSTATAYQAISDANRRKILDILRDDGPQLAGDIVMRLSHISQPAVSKHLRVLREAELVSAEKSGRERRYHLNSSSLRPVAQWLDHYEALWDTRLETLKRLAEEQHAQTRQTPAPVVDDHIYHGPLSITQPLFR